MKTAGAQQVSVSVPSCMRTADAVPGMHVAGPRIKLGEPVNEVICGEGVDFPVMYADQIRCRWCILLALSEVLSSEPALARTKSRSLHVCSLVESFIYAAVATRGSQLLHRRATTRRWNLQAFDPREADLCVSTCAPCCKLMPCRLLAWTSAHM